MNPEFFDIALFVTWFLHKRLVDFNSFMILLCAYLTICLKSKQSCQHFLLISQLTDKFTVNHV